jgi:tRNA threonylcarbamoyl adenosine modification protein (Sua5/YciO/YrdC/YwlC family)
VTGARASTASDAEALERCVAAGGVAVFPADTVYGLACHPDDRLAVERIYLLKRRDLGKPSAVMFFDLELAFEAVPELGERTREAMRRLMPGGVSLLVPNPAGWYPLACGHDVSTLGIRVPRVDRLAGARWPVLQTSANRAGGPDPRRLEDVPLLIRATADLVIDGGELPGTPSTVVDLRRYEETGEWSVVREGAVGAEELRRALDWQHHFDPATYTAMIREEVPGFDRLQDEAVALTGDGARRILELGTGTGETARRLLARHPDATLTGVDVSEEMLAEARAALPSERADLRVARIEEGLPDGSFDLVVSSLAVHHLDGPAKADLFTRVREALAPGGRFVLADVVVPGDPADVRIPLSPGYDHPSTVADQLRWLAEAGLDGRLAWADGDLAILVADLSR